MNDKMRQKVHIGVAIFCLVGALIITIAVNWGWADRSSNVKETFILICSNPQCGAVTEMSANEFRKLAGQTEPGSVGMQGLLIFVCPKCNQKVAYIGQKCENCGKAFIPVDSSNEYPDRCPKCGYSQMEERTGKQR